MRSASGRPWPRFAIGMSLRKNHKPAPATIHNEQVRTTADGRRGDENRPIGSPAFSTAVGMFLLRSPPWSASAAVVKHFRVEGAAPGAQRARLTPASPASFGRRGARPRLVPGPRELLVVSLAFAGHSAGSSRVAIPSGCVHSAPVAARSDRRVHAWFGGSCFFDDIQILLVWRQAKHLVMRGCDADLSGCLATCDRIEHASRPSTHRRPISAG